MAANTREVARNLFRYANGNPARIREIRAAFDSAMTGALTKGGMDNITNATKNGVGMTKMVNLNEEERQSALAMALDWLDAGFVPCASRSYGRF
jgi:hypothetical protein